MQKTTSLCLHLCTSNVGDTVVVTLNNKLGNETTSLHWHGLYQAGSNANDGPPMVTQCPILPGQSYIYTFRVRSSTPVVRMIYTDHITKIWTNQVHTGITLTHQANTPTVFTDRLSFTIQKLHLLVNMTEN